MIKLKLVKIAILCLTFVLHCYGQQTATTNSGRVVILKNDGTWEYANESPKPVTNDSHFRKTAWGMTIKEVKATETLKIEQDDNEILVYSGTISGMDALIAYIFANNKLVRAKYVFIPSHTNKNDYIIDYTSIKKTLTTKYGTPKSDETNWRDDLYKDDFSEWGFAVSLGHLTYYAEWEKSDTEIFLMLSGENYKVRLVSEYTSKAHKELEQKIRQKQKQSEF